MPPSAIIRSVCSAIWRASTPSEVERFTFQYDMRNMRFTVERGGPAESEEELQTWVCRWSGSVYLEWETWERLWSLRTPPRRSEPAAGSSGLQHLGPVGDSLRGLQPRPCLSLEHQGFSHRWTPEQDGYSATEEQKSKSNYNKSKNFC